MCTYVSEIEYLYFPEMLLNLGVGYKKKERVQIKLKYILLLLDLFLCLFPLRWGQHLSGKYILLFTSSFSVPFPTQMGSTLVWEIYIYIYVCIFKLLPSDTEYQLNGKTFTASTDVVMESKIGQKS